MKQRNIPGLGAFMESFFVTLPILGIINFWAIITVLYANVQPYLLQHAPWMNLWIFVGLLTLIGITGMIIVYKFVLSSVWSFRGKQMLDKDNLALGTSNKRLDEIKKELGELKKEIVELRKELKR